MTDTAPRIYVACLASYNNGVLHGRWIDASADVADMWPEIHAMLRESKFPNVTVPDYEAAAKAVGWQWDEGGPHFFRNAPGASPLEPYEYAHLSHEDWRDLCEMENIDTTGHMVPSAEEWAIHDYEGLGPDLGEYAGLAEVAKRVALIDVADDMGLPVPVLMEAANDLCGNDDDADEIKDTLEDRYRGKYDSWEDFAEEFTREVNDMSEVPEWLQNHIDWESVARDFRLGGDFSAIEHDGDFYFFWNH